MSDNDLAAMKSFGKPRHIIAETWPWRTPDLTECGRAIEDVARTCTLGEAAQIQQTARSKTVASLVLCQTCMDTCGRHYWTTWRMNPMGLVNRLTTHHHVRAAESSPRIDRMNIELRAIAALIAEHRDEFDAYIIGVQATTPLDAARKTRKTRKTR